MSNIPSVEGLRLIKILERLGFVVTRIKGSHHILRHPDGRSTVIPVHSKESIGKGLLHKILKDCEMTLAQLIDEI